MKFRCFTAAALAAFAIGAAQAQGQGTAQVQYTLVIQGLGQFPVQAFSWGASSPVSFSSGGSGGTVGRLSMSSLNILKSFDQATTGLWQTISTGNHYSDVRLLGTRIGATEPFLELRMQNVFVESLQFSASAGSLPTESVSFAFANIMINGVGFDGTQQASNAKDMQQLVASIVQKAIAAPATK